MNFAKPLISLLLCLVAQLVALAAGHVVYSVGQQVTVALIAASVVGLSTALLLGLRPAVALLNGLAPIAAFFAIVTTVSATQSTALGVFALLLLLLFIPTLYSGVPYYPTHRRVYEAVLNLLPENQPFVFYELGCGDGRLVAFLAKHRPLGTFVGVELSPLAWLVASLRTIPYRSRVQIRFHDLWTLKIERGDFIYAFLAPPVMERLWMKLSVEAKPGATLISNAFSFPVKADQEILFPEDERSALYIHRT